MTGVRFGLASGRTILHLPVMARLEFNVFGQRVLVERRADGWIALYPGSEGKHRQATDIVIPPEIPDAGLEEYLTDLCHEWASPENSEVRWSVRARPATVADAISIREVHRRAIEAVDRGFYSNDEIAAWAGGVDTNERRAEAQDRLARRLESSVFLIAERGDRAVGFAQLAPDRQEVRGLYVDPAYGGRGIGRSLLERLEEAARERELHGIELEASLNAVSFYLACGYERLEETTHRVGGGAELRCVRMGKRLR